MVLIGGGIGITPFASILQDFMAQVQKEVSKRRREKLLLTSGDGARECNCDKRSLSLTLWCPFVFPQRLEEKERERKHRKRMQQRRGNATETNAAAAGSTPGLSKKNAKGQRLPFSPANASTAQAPPSSYGKPPMLLYFSQLPADLRFRVASCMWLRG